MRSVVNQIHDESNDFECCPVCGTDLEWVRCWDCSGEGEFDEYEDDPVNYGPGEEYRDCEVCGGRGGWLECPALPHAVSDSTDRSELDCMAWEGGISPGI